MSGAKNSVLVKNFEKVNSVAYGWKKLFITEHPVDDNRHCKWTADGILLDWGSSFWKQCHPQPTAMPIDKKNSF